MNEASRLQRMRELGVRLQELHLLPSNSVNSYAGAAINFLFKNRFTAYNYNFIKFFI